ncbi:MAG: hypothetical protein ABJG47_01670 [Ekhidna sp.]
MRYLIITNSQESSDFARLLANEIERFDIRSEIFTNSGKELRIHSNEECQFSSEYRRIKSAHLDQKFDLLCVIGSTFDGRLVSKLRKLQAKTCFFQITADYSTGRKIYEQAFARFHKVYVDVPVYDLRTTSECIGHYVNDLIRKHDFKGETSEELRIGLLINKEANFKKIPNLIKSVSEKENTCRWLIGGKEPSGKSIEYIKSFGNIDFVENRLDVLKSANAVILDSEQDSVAAALLNCPQISIAEEPGFLGFTKAAQSLINKVEGREIIKTFKSNEHEQVIGELDLVLNNHEYCATMMVGYQEFKEKLGAQPVARSAVQKITEWIEKSEV